MHSNVVKRAKLGDPEPWPAHRLGLLGWQRMARVSEIGKLEIRSANGVLRQLRGKKSSAELALIRRAVEITVMAEHESIQAIHPGMNEFEIQALIEYVFRRNGAERPSFSTIVGSGGNSTTLHYNVDDKFGEIVGR